MISFGNVFSQSLQSAWAHSKPMLNFTFILCGGQSITVPQRTQGVMWFALLSFYCGLKWKFLVSLETQLCHVMFLWKLSCETIFCWSKYPWGGCMMFEKSINGTPQTVKGRSCIGTRCSALLVFAGLHFVEGNTPRNFSWYSGWFWPLLTHAKLAEPSSFCWMESLLLICVWCLWLDWTTGIQTMKTGIAPKQLLNKSTTSLSFL